MMSDPPAQAPHWPSTPLLDWLRNPPDAFRNQPLSTRCAWLMRFIFTRMAHAHGHCLDQLPPISEGHFPPLSFSPDQPPEPELLGLIYEQLLDPHIERRSLGAHYTPPAWTVQIIQDTLSLEERPHPSAILKIQVCDPAMGCGAFLLQACRILAHALQQAWDAYPQQKPALAPGESEHLAALRIAAQHCLFGVDKDPIAAQLARASLWLLTRASQSPYAFQDSTLVVGDSLTMCWDKEFPPVYQRANPGFDAMIGNPPFLGGGKISSVHGPAYLERLLKQYPDAHGNADLAAYFFRQAFRQLRSGGKLGFIATNTIAQGDTRATGLGWIENHGGTIYKAIRRRRWPGSAKVIVSIVHIEKDGVPNEIRLDGHKVSNISSYLHAEEKQSAALQKRKENRGKCFLGAKLYGQGFLFQDHHPKATPLAEMKRIIAAHPPSQQLIFPYMGGHEINTDPHQRHNRYVFHFGSMNEAQAQAYPELYAIALAKVAPQRRLLRDNPDGKHRKTFWWLWGRDTPGLAQAIGNLKRVLVCSRIQPYWCISFIDTGPVFSESTAVFAFDSYSAFALLQSRVHETFARRMGSSMKDDMRYTPSDCFEPFPFPSPSTTPGLEYAGREYHLFRKQLMHHEQLGLTALYHRFHHPAEQHPHILTLRQLHDRLDQAAFNAYGWTDLSPLCQFLPDERTNDKINPAYRYQWPPALGAEVLRRLILQNKSRTLPNPNVSPKK